MATKNTFLCYYDWIHYADEMTNEELGMLFRKILQYENQTEEIELPSDFKFIRWKIKASLDENSKKWNDKIEETRKRRSEAWSNHEWNQYTRQREKRKEHKQAKKPSMEQMEQMEQNGTNGTKQFYSYSNSISTNNISNSISNNSIVRNKYLEYVYLSDIEYKKLIETYWEKVIENEIENLNNYIGQKWWKDPYKSHYYTLLNWLRKSWAKKLPTTTTQLNDFQIEDWVYDIDKINSFNS